MPEKENVLVIGGTGFVGNHVAKRLGAGSNFNVLTMSRAQRELSEDLAGLPDYVCDVADDESVAGALLDLFEEHEALRAVVYAVGHCLPGEFDNEVAYPITDLNSNKLVAELDLHVVGLWNVCTELIDHLHGGDFVVIGSAITRLNDKTCPPDLFAAQYAAAKAAQAELVQWLRRDPLVQQNNVHIHYVAPGAIDSPFHHGCRLQPPSMLSIETVVDAVIDAIDGNDVVNLTLVPDPPTS